MTRLVSLNNIRLCQAAALTFSIILMFFLSCVILQPTFRHSTNLLLSSTSCNKLTHYLLVDTSQPE